MAIDINIPSQVKTYANLAAFPATGSLKTIFIAEDTNKTYRWTGSAYVEVSVADLSGYVPTTRTLTINGTTQDLSADRTFTISTGITIGTTAITSGAVGRVLFEGTGNVVQESSSLFWDNTNGRLGIGTSSPAYKLSVAGSIDAGANFIGYGLYNQGIFPQGPSGELRFVNGSGGGWFYTWVQNGSERMRLTTGNNLLINTTTDAGYKLDVNGTARTKYLTIESASTYDAFQFKSNTGINGYFATDGSSVFLSTGANVSGSIIQLVNNGNLIVSPTQGFIIKNGTTETARFTNTTRNFLLGTTTDAGFKLDVNGTAIIRGDFNVGGSAQSGYQFRLTNSAYIGGQLRVDGNTTINATVTVVGVTVLTGGRTVVRDGNSLLVGGSSGSDTPDASALTEIRTTTKGFLPPRMTTTQKNAIATPATGLMVYDNVLNRPCFYDGTTWITL